MFVAEFTRTENVFEGNVHIAEETSIVRINNAVEIQTRKKICLGRVVVSFRPERVEIGKSLSENIFNVFNGRIVSVKEKGNFRSIKIDIGIFITFHTFDQSFKEGLNISIHIPPDSINIIRVN